MKLSTEQKWAVTCDHPASGEEGWRLVPGFAGVEVSDQGRVRVNGVDKPLSLTGKYYRVGRGYLACSIGRKLAKAHRLVALAFCENPYGYDQVDHKNGITTDNRPENLEWVSSSENQFRALKLGLKVPIAGERIGTHKITRSDVIEIRRLKLEGLSTRRIAPIFGISPTQVKRILRRESWRHV